jgi:hypothetical protein
VREDLGGERPGIEGGRGGHEVRGRTSDRLAQARDLDATRPALSRSSERKTGSGGGGGGRGRGTARGADPGIHDNPSILVAVVRVRLGLLARSCQPSARRAGSKSGSHQDQALVRT